jgi:hypothetical protein
MGTALRCTCRSHHASDTTTDHGDVTPQNFNIAHCTSFCQRDGQLSRNQLSVARGMGIVVKLGLHSQAEFSGCAANHIAAHRGDDAFFTFDMLNMAVTSALIFCTTNDGMSAGPPEPISKRDA